ncbi:chemotaxis protein CheW [Desulfonema magnum]|uniref:CheW-like domain-containing protein n=1 Tax=Desulfonema magnum TaxID=45655 RepID=A0A975GMD8_9BACT|nr:chemotaxis protein CheW [Desulfonema magnum]QTA86801.1 CheW-like domain-containing protein [Desulfonema magnum]
MQTNNSFGTHNSKFEQKVIIFPALTPSQLSCGQVFFLFSVRQVEDIIKNTSVHPVPFSSPYIEGITIWRDQVVPVISLEECMGMESTTSGSGFRLLSTRLIIIRILPSFSLTDDEKNEKVSSAHGDILPTAGGKKNFSFTQEERDAFFPAEEYEGGARIMLRVAPGIRMLSLPISCTPLPLASVEWIPKKELVRGVYEWEEGYLTVAHMEKIFKGH